MKYLSTVILLSGAIFSFSAFADGDQPTCTQDLYNLGKCGVHEVVKGAQKGEEALKDDLRAPAHEAKLKIDAATGAVVIDFGGSVAMHLHETGKSLARAWDFSDLKEKKNQDVAHAVGDVGRGVWRDLKKIGGAADDVAVIVIKDERKGFKDHPNTDEDLVGFVNAAGHGTKNVLVDAGDGTYKLFTKVKGQYVARMTLEREKDLNEIIANANKVNIEVSHIENTQMIPEQVIDRYEPKAMEFPVTDSPAPDRRIAGWSSSASEQPTGPKDFFPPAHFSGDGADLDTRP